MGTDKRAGTDQGCLGYRSGMSWTHGYRRERVQIRDVMGTDQGCHGYRSGMLWVQIRDVMGTDKEAGTDQGCHGYR